MRSPHPDPRPSRPPPHALPPGGLPSRAVVRVTRTTAALAVAPLLLASCTDNVAANCPPLAHPEVLTVAAASNPCQARAGESAKQLELRVVQRYQRTQPPGTCRAHVPASAVRHRELRVHPPGGPDAGSPGVEETVPERARRAPDRLQDRSPRLPTGRTRFTLRVIFGGGARSG